MRTRSEVSQSRCQDHDDPDSNKTDAAACSWIMNSSRNSEAYPNAIIQKECEEQSEMRKGERGYLPQR